MELLIKGGADIDAAMNGWVTPLVAAAATFSGHIGIVKLLLRAGVDVKARGTGGRARALSCAADQGNLEIVTLLLQQGASLDGEASDVGKQVIMKARQMLSNESAGRRQRGRLFTDVQRTEEELARVIGDIPANSS